VYVEKLTERLEQSEKQPGKRRVLAIFSVGWYGDCCGCVCLGARGRSIREELSEWVVRGC